MLNTKTGEFSRQEIEHPYETAHRLSEWLRVLASLSPIADCGAQVAEEAVKALGASACCIDITDSAKGTDRSFTFCAPGLELNLVTDVTTAFKPKVALAGETILIDNLDSRLSTEVWIREHSVNKYLGVPLFSRSGDVAGVVGVLGTRSRRFNEEDEWWLKAAGQLVVSAVNLDVLETKLAGLERALTPDVLARADTNSDSEPAQPKPVVLVVDDDREVNNLISELLDIQGYEVKQAFNGVEAMQVFQPAEHKLVITDVAMPLMNGWELVAALRVRNPSLPIIVISGYSTGEWNMNYLARQGVCDVLNKPLDLSKLTSAVDRLLRA